MRFSVIKNFLLVIAIAFLAGVVGFRVGVAQQTKSERFNVNLALFWQVWDELSSRYVDPSKLEPQKLIYGAISGMVSAVGDPYTVFLPPTQNKESKEDLNGKFEGIGASLELKNGQVIVSAPLAGSPAEKAGIKPLDFIMKVDGAETKNWSLSETVSKIRGPKGTKVTLTVVHNNDSNKPVNLTIVRDTIILKSVEWKKVGADNQIIYLHLARFGDETRKQWDEAVGQIALTPKKGIVLDLRNNPGGLLSESVYIASEFLKSGVVVKQQNNKKEDQTYSVNRVGKLTEVPMVVLVNQGTASASEILAGALQVSKRAQIVGTQTFGKGSVQEVEDFSGGAGLHVTVAKWLLANDVWVNGTGLTPDVKIESEINEASADAQLKKAIITLEGNVR